MSNAQNANGTNRVSRIQCIRLSAEQYDYRMVTI